MPNNKDERNPQELALYQSKIPTVFKKKESNQFTPMVVYAPIDSSHYSFTYDFDSTISFRMDEAESSVHSNDFVEAEFSDTIPESEKIYCALAATSGALTGTLSFLKLSESQLKSIDDFKKKDWQPIVIYSAELAGCRKKDYKSASKYIVDQAIRKAKKDDTVKEYTTLLASHPTMAGLFFSMIIQFAGKQYTISETGEITSSKLPKYYYIGESNSEKIVSAVMYWLFSLAANQAQSKRSILDSLPVPTELLKKIKTLVNFSFFKKIPENYESAEEQFSIWLKNTIDGTNLETDPEDAAQNNIAIKLMKIALDVGDDAFPVLINECVVRSLYVLVRLCDIIKERQIDSFEHLQEIPATQVLPQNNRLLSKMCLIASASFVGVNLTIAAGKAIAEKKANGRKFLTTFLAEVNIAGIGRLVFACVSDSKYWGEDIKPIFQRKPHSHIKEDEPTYNFNEHEVFKSFELNPIQARALYCFENISIIKDIEKTKKVNVAENKQLWLDDWRRYIYSAANVPLEYEDVYFVTDETILYNWVYEISKDKNNFEWFYLLTQELALFRPYFALGTENDSTFKNLNQEYDYISDQFIRRQTIVSQAEVDAILKTYKKSQSYVSGKTAKIITTAIGGTALTAITGGLALTFAPGIAALIAGEAVVGLHGAALTSASLAFVGGGSLAAGGLGMAGGTAIITGGGALIGLAGTGGASAASFMLMATNDYWVRQSAKLLTFSTCVLSDTLKDKKSLDSLLHQVNLVESDTRREIEAINKEKNDLDKEYIKKLKEYHSCLVKVRNELQLISKKQWKCIEREL